MNGYEIPATLIILGLILIFYGVIGMLNNRRNFAYEDVDRAEKQRQLHALEEVADRGKHRLCDASIELQDLCSSLVQVDEPKELDDFMEEIIKATNNLVQLVKVYADIREELNALKGNA